MNTEQAGTEESLHWLPFLLQTSDPLFPTGSYAHSLGLEEIVRIGVVKNEPGLLRFLRGQVIPVLEHLELPFLRFAREAAAGADIESLCDLDQELSAIKVSRELREASIQVGVRRLQILLKTAPSPAMERFEVARRAGKASGHHLVVYGIQGVCMPLEAVLYAWFYQTLAGLCGASLKLIRIGQEGCQRILRDCLRDAPDCVRRSLSLAREDAGWFNPLLDIAAMRHENAGERLFIS